MNGYKFFGLILTAALILALCSCGQSVGSAQTVHQSKRDNIEDANLISIDDSLPMLHDASFLTMLGDTLILRDHKSTDKMFVAYDIPSGRYIGSFGQFGAGPGELSNAGGVFTNGHNLYCINGGSRKMVKFDVDTALTDSLYKPIDIIEIVSFSDGLLKHPYNYNIVNDSMLICCVKMHHPDTHKMESCLGKFDMNTGDVKVIDDVMHPVVGRNNNIGVSVADSLIVIYSYDQDRIKFSDLNGNVFKVIRGPNFSEELSRGIEYFSNVTIGGDRLFAVYLNRPLTGDDKRSDIIVMDLEGNYLKTYRMNDHIWDMVYNESTGRLYVSCDGDPQFGYIQID